MEGRKKATNCIVLKQDALQREMNNIISEVAQMTDLDPGAIRILLDRLKWDKENLLERFYECDGVRDLQRRLGLVLEPSLFGDGVDGVKRECGICCGVDVLTGPKCRHYACRNCWEQYLTTKILVQSTSKIECLYPGCKLLLADEFVSSLLSYNSPARPALTRLSINGFVQSSRRLRWCPATNCGRVIKVGDFATRGVACECGCRFCFECASEVHDPVGCIMLKAWLKKCEDDSETCNWINSNTKDCPKCHVAIEKNGGCNHMTCRQDSCKYEFCWICLGDWKKHNNNYSCNVYEASKDDKASASRASLERYLHYYTRFVTHQQSRKLETKLIESVKKQMDDMQKRSMTWVEVQFLNRPVQVLAECRQTLMYTYAFAFYLKKTNVSQIFEDNQKDLELATEKLSGLLENDLDFVETKDLERLKIEVQDRTKYVELRRSILLEQCEEESWVFNK